MIAAVTTDSAASPSLILSSEDMVEKGPKSLGQKFFGFRYIFIDCLSIIVITYGKLS